jgi:hypothetical protein
VIKRFPCVIYYRIVSSQVIMIALGGVNLVLKHLRQTKLPTISTPS